MEKRKPTDITRFSSLSKPMLYGRIVFWVFIIMLAAEILFLLSAYLIYMKLGRSLKLEIILLSIIGIVLSIVISVIMIWVIQLIVDLHMQKPKLNSDEEFALLIELNNAIKNLEFQIYFQPQFNLKTNKIVGMETLLRWDHPKHGVIMPSYFIPLAEKAGLIEAIGEWTILQACILNKQLLDKGFNLCVTVNISPLQFNDENLVENVMKILAITQLPPQNLELEITETAMIDNLEYVIETMLKFRKMGVVLSIDDFGTGYSSLAHVDQLPIDKLKIDKSFVQHLSRKNSNSNIAYAIIQMAHKLDLRIIVEGIENAYQKDYFTELGCHEGQGFYLGAPIPAEKFFKYLTSLARDFRT